MRKRIRPLNLALLLSLPMLVAGVILASAAYYKYAATEAAAEQIEFLKNLPSVIDPGKEYAMPVASYNPIMEQNPGLHGTLTCYYYENNVSLRAARAVIRDGLLFKTELICIVDSRVRN
jgi:hypothetical protein